jgi:hypothetical protein
MMNHTVVVRVCCAVSLMAKQARGPVGVEKEGTSGQSENCQSNSRGLIY